MMTKYTYKTRGTHKKGRATIASLCIEPDGLPGFDIEVPIAVKTGKPTKAGLKLIEDQLKTLVH